ncbi:unnamed protein product [Clonostachys byssicola]|uniref:Bulb-type lectin domain-containing protein n=1 Tax=Clonostachys byssicola TaxID=160290 RepID=A0A9N9UFX2_9HYPO|nr:unnamed protein product [Clonostachys byssicola]
MIPTRLLVALASLLPLAVAECSKPCTSRCARALLDPVGSTLQKESCLAFIQQGEDATVPVELNAVCRLFSCLLVHRSVADRVAILIRHSSYTLDYPVQYPRFLRSGKLFQHTNLFDFSSHLRYSGIYTYSRVLSYSGILSCSRILSHSRILSYSRVLNYSGVFNDSSLFNHPGLHHYPRVYPSSLVRYPSLFCYPRILYHSYFFNHVELYVEGDSTPHNTGFRAITNGFALSWNYVPTVPGKLGIDAETGRLYALLDGRTDKLWGSTYLPLTGSLLLSFWTPAQIAAYEGSIVYVKCTRDADGYVTCGYEDQDLARLKPGQNQNVVLGKHFNSASTVISMLEYPVPAGYPTVQLRVK